MAGLANCSTAFSSSRTPRVALKIHGGTTAASLKLRNRRATIRAEVNFVDVEEARRLVEEEGYAILDVRDQTQYDRSHIKSCYHVPLFVENKDNDLGTIIKRTVHNNFSGLFFGLPFTKLNPDFVKSVKEQFSTDSKLLLVCQEGLRGLRCHADNLLRGSKSDDLAVYGREGCIIMPTNFDGKSTAAANKLDEGGFKSVSCVMSGLQSVKPGCSTVSHAWIIQIFNIDNVACIDILVKTYCKKKISLCRNIRICWFYRTPRRRQGWSRDHPGKDFCCIRNSTHLCLSFHNILPSTSRKATSTEPHKLVLVVKLTRLDNFAIALSPLNSLIGNFAIHRMTCQLVGTIWNVPLQVAH